MVRDFLASFRWELTDHTNAGVTWVELYAAFEIHGYKIESDDKHAEKLGARTHLAQRA